MRKKADIDVGNAEELRETLRSWGRVAPARLERRGKQAELDRWVMARWLASQLEGEALTFPLRVWQGENPDFHIDFGCWSIGLEVTEAVDENEQIAWTISAKGSRRTGTYAPHPIEKQRPIVEMYAQLVRRAVQRKSTTCSSACTELLVYLNTSDKWFDDMATQSKKIEHAISDQNRFDRVWVKSDEYMLCFPRSRSTEAEILERADAKPREVTF